MFNERIRKLKKLPNQPNIKKKEKIILALFILEYINIFIYDRIEITNPVWGSNYKTKIIITLGEYLQRDKIDDVKL
ncbi:MAG: hypothetical protein JXC36_03610 [Candidatus Atribacteria bacterium]|nr:hypothetical protein [Candidatus Atribacteria bacterium]